MKYILIFVCLTVRIKCILNIVSFYFKHSVVFFCEYCEFCDTAKSTSFFWLILLKILF